VKFHLALVGNRSRALTGADCRPVAIDEPHVACSWCDCPRPQRGCDPIAKGCGDSRYPGNFPRRFNPERVESITPQRRLVTNRHRDYNLAVVPLSVHKVLSRLASLDPNVGFLLLVFGLITLALWLGALQSCMGNEPPSDSNRLKWIALILFLGPIGALAYLFIRRPQRIRDVGW
jgi:hypothetical protein